MAQPDVIGMQYSTLQPCFTCMTRSTCGKDSYLDVCVRCLQSPTTEPTRTPEPSISLMTTSGRPIKSPVPHAFPPNQVSCRFSVLHVVHVMLISCRFRIVDPLRTLQSDGLRKTRTAAQSRLHLLLCSPRNLLHHRPDRPATITTNEAFELQ